MERVLKIGKGSDAYRNWEKERDRSARRTARAARN